jgi:flagellar hook assembly protein FlgD
VGTLTKVPAQPYNIKYRLSKDATTTITVWDTDVSHRAPGSSQLPLVRTIIRSQPRVGEGTPDGTLTNGDFWDGRDDNGNIVPAGSYLVRIDASSNDDWSATAVGGGTVFTDHAWPTTIQMTLDPLQVTDVGVKPLGVSSTDQAVVSYLLTEAATMYVDIYPPNTIFDDVNTSPPTVGGQNRCDGNVGQADLCIRQYIEQQEARRAQSTYWDGRDSQGRPVCDGNYVYAAYAVLASSGSHGIFGWNNVRTRRTMVGTVPVARGPVLAFMQPSSTVMGSTVQVGGLDPFYFRYTPTRDMTATLRIKDMNGVSTVRTLFADEVRFANMQNREVWDGRRDDGRYVSSGTYLAELITKDPYVCDQQATSTMTALIPVHLFRILDPRPTPLLGASTAYAALGYELSQSMYAEFKVYPTSVTLSAAAWPPVVTVPTVYSISGLRPGRMRVTEPWDGRNASGEFVPDGRYPYSLVAYTTGTAQVMYATDKVYGYLDVARGQILFSSFDVYPTVPTMYSSSDIVKLPPYGIEYSLTRIASVTVAVATMDDPPRVMAYIAKGEVREGDTLHKDFWDGRCTEPVYCPKGDFLPDGLYNVVVTARDLADPLRPASTAQQNIDYAPVQIYDLSIAPLMMDGQASVNYQVSEPMKVVTKIYRPGQNPPLDVYSTDTTGLVKRIIGVRPSRTLISESWDGTDFTLSKVPDGNYSFRVAGSTMTDAVDTLTGNITYGARIANYLDENIPVIRSGTSDLCGDFARETFFAPNPYTGESGWFHIPVMMNGRLALKIYNIAGDLVYEKDYGTRGGGQNVSGRDACAVTHTDPACWPRVNSYGRRVAPGVYLAVVRFEATEGTRDVCQTVKKILVP